ncbi:MAG: hypothetical protein M5U28_46620 [Sandaracinaceae bacterium]|nr:hypothetical protein [Sandaracinaceae bacterium]
MIAYLLGRGDVASATTLVGQLERPLSPRARFALRGRAPRRRTQRRRIEELEALGRETTRRSGAARASSRTVCSRASSSSAASPATSIIRGGRTSA